MKHVVCYSGGYSSALVAIEVARRYGTDDLILLNHDINPTVEDEDIKRFKAEVAAYIGVPITYANMEAWETKDQFDVCVEARAFKVGNGTALCTNRLKTAPYDRWLLEHHPTGEGLTIYYGFDANETNRITRRSQIMGARGYKTEYPLAYWEVKVLDTEEIGIKPPMTYSQFRHANCVGCLKAGKQHWCVVYCTRPDVWQKAKQAEIEIGHSIFRDTYLDDMEPLFETMKAKGIPATENIVSAQFWRMAKAESKQLNIFEDMTLPCECVV